MTFENHQPEAPIAAHIEAIFHYKDLIPDHSIERVVPTGHIFLLFELDGIPRNTFNNDTLVPDQTFSEVWISGMHKKYISISAHEEAEMLVIQFKAGGAYPFFHFPLHEINEKVIPAAQLLGTEILDLRKDLLAASDAKAKLILAENWLQQRYQAEKAPNATITTLIEELKKAPSLNGKELNRLVQAYPHTQKHLIDQFKKYVGLTPKYYQRILRFNEILAQIHQKEKLSWTQISYDCGYADQSHFIKEFKHFSGFNPEEFIQQKFTNEEINFFPLDREETDK